MGLSQWLRRIPAVQITRTMIDKAIADHRERMRRIEEDEQRHAMQEAQA